MRSKDRQKMCLSCDGRIPFDADLCPYCAAPQAASGTQSAANDQMHHHSLQESLTSLYSPPYASKKGESKLPGTSHQPITPPKDTMADKRFNSSISLGAPTIPVEAAEEQASDEARSGFWPILLLSTGGNLLTIGLLQLFFSDNGMLRLEWDSSYWFVYCLAAFPLFFFGFKKANGIK